MARVTTEVCDVCRNKQRQVMEYRLARDSNKLMRLVLCREHAEPIEQLLKIGTPTSSYAPGAKVWTIEEIESEKKRLKKNGA